MSATKENNFCNEVSLEDYVCRILILGTTENTYSSSASRKIDKYSISFLEQQIQAGNGQKILNVVEEIFISGRAPKQEMTLMTHAMLCRAEDINLRKNALQLVSKYRTLAQLYLWKTFHADVPNADGEKSKGYGRAVKRVINEWIFQQTPRQLAYQLTKYPHRHKWGIKQIMQCAHPKSGSGDDRVFPPAKKNETQTPLTDATPIDLVLRYAVNGYKEMKKLAKKYDLKATPEYKYLKAVNWAKTNRAMDEPNRAYLIKLIQKHTLTREQISTEGLALLDVQKALLLDETMTKVTMPLTALLRNLANLTRFGVFADNAILNVVVKHLLNPDIIKKARVHPVNVLLAWFTYKAGEGERGKHKWNPHLELVKGLEEMFYLSFQTLKPTGERLCVLIDASGSMSSPSACKVISNAEAAALLAMGIARAEANSANPVQHSFYIFTAADGRKTGTGLTDVSDLIHADASFENVLDAVQRSDWGQTDISLGITEAAKFNRRYDAFIVITDNDVNSGIKPSFALDYYRGKMKMETKLAVIACQATNFSIADTNDKGMMDFVGFDSHLPKLLQQFIARTADASDDFQEAEDEAE